MDAHAVCRAGEQGARGTSPPVRLLTLTTLFPNGRQPRHGIFVANRLRRLCDTGRVESTVVAAVPSFPGAYRSCVNVPAAEKINDFDTRHPRFFNVPGLGMRFQPRSLARALLAELRNIGADASRFDVIDAHYFYPDGVAAARVADALGLPLVISARGSDINAVADIPFARRRMLEAATRAQALIAVSEALARKMVQIGMPSDRIHVLRNGVDTELFVPLSRVEARKRLGLNEEARWVVAVGNLVPEKGLDVLIRAVGALGDTRLLIVGDGVLRKALRKRAQKLAPARIIFRGNMPQSELRYAYAAGDVLALPSLREGWPNVLLEAIACGTPVVASDVGGVPEILRDESAGVRVRSRTVEEWVDALRRALSADYSREALRRYAMQFGWDDVVARQCALYDDIAQAHNKRRCDVAR
jgi:glycosyltransferase involved in cell wall biosynthesis